MIDNEEVVLEIFKHDLQPVYREESINSELSISLNGYDSGVYFIKAQKGEVYAIAQFVVQE